MGKIKRAGDIVTSHFSHYSSKEEYKKVTKSLSNQQTQFNLAVCTKRNRKQYTEELARERANYLARELNNPSRFMFYLKCAWNLTDSYLDRLLHIAQSKTDAIRYFSAAASREMQRNAHLLPQDNN